MAILWKFGDGTKNGSIKNSLGRHLALDCTSVRSLSTSFHYKQLNLLQEITLKFFRIGHINILSNHHHHHHHHHHVHEDLGVFPIPCSSK
jgi:hypothetical protein